jgi:hypothetical protein
MHKYKFKYSFQEELIELNLINSKDGLKYQKSLNLEHKNDQYRKCH